MGVIVKWRSPGGGCQKEEGLGFRPNWSPEGGCHIENREGREYREEMGVKEGAKRKIGKVGKVGSKGG